MIERPIRRIVIGIAHGREWATEEVITKRRSRRARRKIKICRKCKQPIRGEYYSNRVRSKSYWGWTTGWHRHGRGRHYGSSFGVLPYPRMCIHLICENCWRGEKLHADGTLTKFIDLGKPAGMNVRIVPFRSR